MSEDTESTILLLERLRDGDESARGRLVERHLPTLQRWARGRLPGYARGILDTDDLVQTTLLRAMHQLDRFEVRREGALLAYLRRILINALRDEIRASSRRSDGELPDPLPDPSPSLVEQAIGREALERYEAALAELPERQREAIILRMEFGYSHREVADALGVASEDAARMTVQRGMKRLAELLDD